MNYADLTSKMRDRTAPRPAAVARVRARLDRALVPATELRGLPPIPSAAVARVKARLAERPERRPVPVWLGASLAFAAVAVGIAGALHGASAPEPPSDHALAGAGRLELSGLSLEHDGDGRVVAGPGRVDITWELGTLRVAADRDRPVAVTTPEGRFEGDGAGFEVVRDALGTRMVVTAGRVVAGCGDQPGAPAADATCDPLTASGWLNRAHAHLDLGASADEILRDLTTGLSRADAVGPVQGELWTLTVATLVGAGRSAEALDAAEAALARDDGD
ncbi:MAG: hypothetical protein ABMA64_24640, partial [Myxococcota bacterium]